MYSRSAAHPPEVYYDIRLALKFTRCAWEKTTVLPLSQVCVRLVQVIPRRPRHSVFQITIVSSVSVVGLEFIVELARTSALEPTQGS